MKGFTHEKARNVISDFRYSFHNIREHITNRYNTIFIENPLIEGFFFWTKQNINLVALLNLVNLLKLVNLLNLN